MVLRWMGPPGYRQWRAVGADARQNDGQTGVSCFRQGLASARGGVGWGAQKVRCRPATQLKPRLPSHGLHGLGSFKRRHAQRPVRMFVAFACPSSLTGGKVLAFS